MFYLLYLMKLSNFHSLSLSRDNIRLGWKAIMYAGVSLTHTRVIIQVLFFIPIGKIEGNLTRKRVLR